MAGLNLSSLQLNGFSSRTFLYVGVTKVIFIFLQRAVVFFLLFLETLILVKIWDRNWLSGSFR